MHMKISRGKIPFSIMAIVVSGIMLAGLMFAEDLRALTGTSFLKLKANLYSSAEVERKAAVEGRTEGGGGGGGGGGEKADAVPKGKEKCSASEGKWVMNRSKEVPYSDTSCPFLDIQVTCLSNGRPDHDYLYWEWELDDPSCTLPRFDGVSALEKLRGKRLMFVGDSLQRAQWQSFVCLVQAHIPPHLKSMNRTPSLSVFKAKEYNATIEFYWAPFLVESNTDTSIVNASRRIIRVDSIARHAQHWIAADILVFNSYVWWLDGETIKSLWGSFGNGEEGFEELDLVIAYRLSLKTWANWIDSAINPNSTRVFFTTVSPTHMRSSDWRRKKGIRCYNETMPMMRRGYWGSGSDKRIMRVVASVVERMKVPVTFLNITQLSEYRIDGHTSVYSEFAGKVLSDKQKANPKRYADCIHWCLPGVPDTWNRLLFAYL